MSNVLAELQKFQKILCKDYDVWKIDDDFESCTDIAYHFAVMLLKEGKAPEILECSHGFDGFQTPDKYLYPVPYPGEKWSGHHVCACDELVYDPIFDKPVDLKAYSFKAFKENIPFKIYAGTEDIQERLALIQMFEK